MSYFHLNTCIRFETVIGSMAIGCLIVLNNDNDTKAFSASNKLLLLVNTYRPKDITETFLIVSIVI
jgi:hypothetical protein